MRSPGVCSTCWHPVTRHRAACLIASPGCPLFPVGKGCQCCNSGLMWCGDPGMHFSFPSIFWFLFLKHWKISLKKQTQLLSCQRYYNSRNPFFSPRSYIIIYNILRLFFSLAQTIPIKYLTLYLGKINYRNKYLSKIGKACLEGTLNPKFPSCTSLPFSVGLLSWERLPSKMNHY